MHDNSKLNNLDKKMQKKNQFGFQRLPATVVG